MGFQIVVIRCHYYAAGDIGFSRMGAKENGQAVE